MIKQVCWTDKADNDWIVLIKIDNFTKVKAKGPRANSDLDAAGYTDLEYSVVGLDPDGKWKPTSEQRDVAIEKTKKHDFEEELLNNYLDDEEAKHR